MNLCPHCSLRRRSEPTYTNDGKYCDTCQRACDLTHTSIDDARHGIREADIDVVYMCAKFEKSRPNPRRVFMQMLNSRLRKLTGLNSLEL